MPEPVATVWVPVISPMTSNSMPTSFQSAPARSTRISRLTLRFRGPRAALASDAVSRSAATPYKASPRSLLKPLGKSLARFSYENEQFVFRDPHDFNTLLRCLESHSIGNVFTRDEERPGQLPLMTFRILQQAAELGSSRFCSSCRNKLRTKNEATRRVHQRDAVEITITFGPDRRVVETERDPSFVDLKLFGVKHAKTVLVSPNNEVERRGASPASNEGTLFPSSTSSLAHRRRDPRSLEPIVRRRP